MPRFVRVLLVTLPLFVGLAVGAWFLFRPPEPDPVGPPTAGDEPATLTPTPAAGKLVVLLVFDQMRGDDLVRWASAFGPVGFERLKRDGVWFADAYLPSSPTQSAPGHASAVTGVVPATHGVTADGWLDRSSRIIVTPAADRLLVESVGDRLKAATAGCGRVVSLALDPTAAALMGGKRPDVALAYDSQTGRFRPAGGLKPPAWAEAFDAGKPAHAWASKPWDRLRPDLDYDKLAGPDDGRGEGGGSGQRRTFPHPFGASAQLGPDYFSAVETSPAGNDLLLGLAKAAVTGDKLGRGPAADLLCLGLTASGRVGRVWGPDSWEALDVTLRSDQLLADLIRFLDGSVGAGAYTLVVTAAHGACPLPEQKRQPVAARLSPRELFTGLAVALDEVYGPSPAGPTKWLDPADPDGSRFLPWVYLNHAGIKYRGLDPAAVADYAAQWVGNRPALLTAVTRRQIESDTAPPAGLASRNQVDAAFRMVKAGYHPDRCGDFVVIPRPGVLLTPALDGTAAGSPHPYDTHVPLLAFGRGVPAVGKVGRRVSPLMTAAVVARALGLGPPARADPVPAEIANPGGTP